MHQRKEPWFLPDTIHNIQLYCYKPKCKIQNNKATTEKYEGTSLRPWDK